MKPKTTLKLVSGMKSLPLGKTAGKKPIAWSKVSPKGKTAPLPPKISRTHKPDGVALEDWQRALRRQFGEQQPFILVNVGGHPLFPEFALTNPESGKTYRIAIRGEAPGMNYCSCPDFHINNLGTCKHIEFTLAKLSQQQGAKKRLREGYTPSWSEIWLSYGLKRQIRFRAGKDAPAELSLLAARYFDGSGVLRESSLLDFHTFLEAIPSRNGHEVRCYDDVMAYVAECQDAAHRRAVVDARLPEGSTSPLFDALLKTDLYPYQKEGALFAVRAGRCLLGDDMGLGKTIQAIAAAELMATLFNIGKVLIISPTSLKYQWKTEIEKFCDRTAQVVEGLNRQRREFYRSDSFYKLINYELVARDLDLIREWSPDLIILDEAQRIKNWKTRTAKTVKELESTFALVLTGTPIENRIEELHSLMEFVDRHHLGPLYRFVHNHRVTDAAGKVVGYRELEKVRHSLQGVMIRRKKSEVLKQLPARIDQNFLVPLTPQQQTLHDEFKEIVAKLVAKWRRYRFLCEADQRRMQIALAMMRMAADNTYLVDHTTVHGPKIEELEILLKELVVEGGEKAVVFSQWLRMTELIENMLERNGIGYAHLNGGVPSKNRGALMKRFKEDPACKVFLSTDAGGVGLNLQSGSIVVNMDIPWNPAVLEQRIGRVHRMGQDRTVRVVNFVSRASIEERILELLRFKKSLFAGVLDEDGANVVMVGEVGMEKFIQSVEEAVAPLAPPDPELERQERIEAAADEQAAEMRERAEDGLPAVTGSGVKIGVGAAAGPGPGIRAGEGTKVETDAGIGAVSGSEARTGTGVAADAGIGGGAGDGAEALNTLLVSGAQFLMNLSKAIAQPAGVQNDPAGGGGPPPPDDGVPSLQKTLQGVLGRDEATGKTYLKIPLPEAEAMNRIVSGLGQLLSGFIGTNRQR
jgi:superfamily II DNA or RNA helicase